jgi:universal stress protein A
MLHYEHVLLATDLTPGSEQVADKAQIIAERAKAKLSLVHVVEQTPLIYGSSQFSVSMDSNLEDNMKAQANQALNEMGERIQVPATQQHIRHGSPKEVVNEMVESHNIDLVVVGTHGRKGIKVLLGSTANAILHVAKCDVWVVHLPPTGQSFE